MKRFKKTMAGIMAAAMMMSSATVYVAGDALSIGEQEVTTGTQTGGSVNGSGTTVTPVDKEVFRVVLPTIVSGNPFDFILDPSGVIEATSGTAYDVNFATYGSVYFKNITGDTYEYNTKSEELTVTNKSSVDVDITLNAIVKTTSGSGLTFVSSSAFGQSTDTSMYLALNGYGNDTANTATSAAVTASGSEYVAKITAEIASCNAYYHEQYNATTQAYEYVIKDEFVDATYSNYNFYLDGVCNTAANWATIKDAPQVTLAWTVKGQMAEKTPISQPNPVFSAGSGVGEITWVNGDDLSVKSITKIEMTNDGTTYNGYIKGGSSWSAATVDLDNCKVTLDSKFCAFFVDEGENKATITYLGSDNETYIYEYTVTVKVQ
ncbi:MAG: hypothetical protein IKJ01_04635 [Lachnospiraceae bacterium]|nr:hypothetical protein [Lachnospiraceae bacterium]